MTVRLIDLMCARHRDLILDTRLWPDGYIPGNHNPGNNSCHDCAVAGARQPSGPIRTGLPVDQHEESAVHEAGHVVAHLHAGARIDYVTLEPGDMLGSLAHTSLWLNGDEGSDGHLQGLWGGQAATLYWLGRERLIDDATVIDVVCNSGMDSTMLFETGRGSRDLRRAREHTDGLVVEHWDTIERVADMLLARGRLSGNEIADLAGLAGCVR